ncbi:MAG: ABC transporter substrate-binding protein [Casimicrobium sp.]|jgi:branched-chain amino acid transport system substrate-binding protein
MSMSGFKRSFFRWQCALFLAATSTILATGFARAEDIVLGQSVALSGPAQELGREMQLGAKTYFDQVNASGGIRGRKIVLKTLDDGYEPPRAAANTTQFVEDGDVLALFGYVGTPTSAASLPIAIKAKVPFFGAFSGAELLRTPMNRYVFNVRASYFDETETIVRQMTQGGVTKIAVFYQNDSYGQAGLNGVEKALSKRNLKVVAKATVERNSTDVSAALATMLAAKPEVIVMISAYGSCAEFIKQAKAKQLATQFVNVSFVGTRALANALGPAADGVMISQVMPPPTANKFSVVVDYQKALRAAGVKEFSYTSLEGYIAARVFVEALRRGGDASREALIRALESLRNVDIGGFNVALGPDNHNASRFVEMTVLNKAGEVRY